MTGPDGQRHLRREELGADCARCFGLCCVALAFARSADFPFDKPAGEPCENLDARDACRIHTELRPRGFKGCIAFDCFGAGQKVSQHTFHGRSWRDAAGTRAAMVEVFPIVRRLHELLWYLHQAITLSKGTDCGALVWAQFERVRALSDESPHQLAALDVDAEYDAARPLLIRVSDLARTRVIRSTMNKRSRLRLGPGKDLAGATLAHADLRGVSLRGSLMMGADMSEAQLAGCDVLGVDMRDANLSGADLREAIYLTQMQVDSARGDHATVLPTGFRRPVHWTAP